MPADVTLYGYTRGSSRRASSAGAQGPHGMSHDEE